MSEGTAEEAPRSSAISEQRGVTRECQHWAAAIIAWRHAWDVRIAYSPACCGLAAHCTVARAASGLHAGIATHSWGRRSPGPDRPGGGGEGDGSVCTLEQGCSWRPPIPGWQLDIAGGALSCRGMYCYVQVLGVPAGAAPLALARHLLQGCGARFPLSRLALLCSLCGQPLLPQNCL